MHIQHQYVNHKHSRVRLWPTQDTILASYTQKSIWRTETGSSKQLQLSNGYNQRHNSKAYTYFFEVPEYNGSPVAAPLNSACQYRSAIVRALTCMEVQPQANSQVESAGRKTRSLLSSLLSSQEIYQGSQSMLRMTGNRLRPAFHAVCVASLMHYLC